MISHLPFVCIFVLSSLTQNWYLLPNVLPWSNWILISIIALHSMTFDKEHVSGTFYCIGSILFSSLDTQFHVATTQTYGSLHCLLHLLRIYHTTLWVTHKLFLLIRGNNLTTHYDVKVLWFLHKSQFELLRCDGNAWIFIPYHHKRV